jgi:hypothetical protein
MPSRRLAPNITTGSSRCRLLHQDHGRGPDTLVTTAVMYLSRCWALCTARGCGLYQPDRGANDHHGISSLTLRRVERVPAHARLRVSPPSLVDRIGICGVLHPVRTKPGCDVVGEFHLLGLLRLVSSEICVRVL